MKQIAIIALFVMAMTTSGYSQHKHPPISITNYLHAFNQIPDSGKTTYAVSFIVAIANTKHPKAPVAIPNPLHPKEVFSATKWRMGHVFLMLSKKDSTHQVTQYIGFYARSPLRAYLSGKAVPSEIVDNGKHRFNAMVTIPVNAHQFQQVLNYVILHATQSYSILQYNCVHFALGAFNAAGIQVLDPHVHAIPVLLPKGLLLPGNVYKMLCQMHADPEGKNIYVASCDTSVGPSYGAAAKVIPTKGATIGKNH